MKQPINEEEEIFRMEMRQILDAAVGSDYAYCLCQDEAFSSAVKKNVEETSAWAEEGYYNEDDIRLAIGRIVMDKFGIDF